MAPTASVSVVGAPRSPISGYLQLRESSWNIELSTSQPVVSLPSELVLQPLSGDPAVSITLTGQIPGSLFTGVLEVNGNLAEGEATFSLPVDALVNADGEKGSQITNTDRTVEIDQVTPQRPSPPVAQ